MNAQEWINQYIDNEYIDCGYNYKDTDGCSYKSLNDLLQSGIFKFCGCGRSDDNLQYILNAFKHIQSRMVINEDKLISSDDKWKKIKEDELNTFGSEGSAYFFYYWADKEQYTEHGGSVPGWLSDKGKLMLEVLETINFEE